MSNPIRTEQPRHHHHHSQCKKRKRGESRVFRFRTFGATGHPTELNEPSFRQNVKRLLEFGHFESSGLMASWSFQLEVHRHPPLHLLLFVVEEPIEASKDLPCKHCQYIGWGNQMICNKKYHFVIPSKDTMAAFIESEGSNYNNSQKESLFNLVGLQGHVLHGMFHSNGFGHLLCLNGFESGSDLSGQQIMDFWDRLCTGLRARKVGLNDTSHKRGMDLRLLHGVAHGEPWFGRWGYRFGSGTYGVTQPIYQKALEAIQNVPLCLINHHLTNLNHEFSMLLSKYQTLSNDPLITLHDLFLFMFDLQSRLPPENYVDSRNHIISIDNNNCRWSQKRIQMAIKVIIESLKKVEYKWISRQEVRDAARIYIGDTGLLDFVLKSLGNQIVGNYLVRRSLNPVKKVLEYCLEDISNILPNHDLVALQSSMGKNGYNRVTRAQVARDMLYLYKYVLKDHKGVLDSTGILSTIPMAARAILDTKYFVKEYNMEIAPKSLNMGFEERLKLFCTVVVKTCGRDEENRDNIPMPQYECITIKKNATFNDLYIEVERVFKEIYWRLRDIVVESITDLRVSRTDLVFGAVEVGRKIVLEGRKEEKGEGNGLVMMRGNNIVECGCGAKEEDGERMVCCDICEVWQHTRCVNIPNNEEVPHIFLCKRCDQEILPLSSLP